MTNNKSLTIIMQHILIKYMSFLLKEKRKLRENQNLTNISSVRLHNDNLKRADWYKPLT